MYKKRVLIVVVVSALSLGGIIGGCSGYAVGTMRCDVYDVNYLEMLSEAGRNNIGDDVQYRWMRNADIRMLNHYKIVVPNSDGANSGLGSVVVTPLRGGYPMIECFDYDTNGLPDKVVVDDASRKSLAIQFSNDGKMQTIYYSRPENDGCIILRDDDLDGVYEKKAVLPSPNSIAPQNSSKPQSGD